MDYRSSHKATSPDEHGLYDSYTLTAYLANGGADGRQVHFTDQTGIVRVHLAARASASDPALVP